MERRSRQCCCYFLLRSLGSGQSQSCSDPLHALKNHNSSTTSPETSQQDPSRRCSPQDLVPRFLQPVNSIALQSREDGSEGGEVLQEAALLGTDKGTPC